VTGPATRAVPQRDTLVATRYTLELARDRMAELAAGPFSEDMVRELLLLWNNTTYLFLYLDANDEFVDATPLAPLRQTLRRDGEFVRRLRAALDAGRCEHPGAERTRAEFAAVLMRHGQDREEDGLLAEAMEVLAALDTDGRQLLARLGARTVPAHGARAELGRLCAATRSSVTRQKLMSAWRMVEERQATAMVTAVDRMAEARHRRARSLGAGSAAARTFARCQVDESSAWGFLEDWLSRAVADAAALEAEIREVTGEVPRPLDHLGFAQRERARRGALPVFDPDAVIALAFRVAEETFALRCQRLVAEGRRQERIVVRVGERPLGEIRLDRWRLPEDAPGPATPGGWPLPPAQPLAHISCRHLAGPGGRPVMSLDDVMTFLHEFGHAVNHLLLQRLVPAVGGLEYLPPERLDHLSMWFEKWAFHPRIAQCLAPGQDADGLLTVWTLKRQGMRRDALERGLVAAIDFQIHAAERPSVREAYRRLDDRYGISALVHLPEVLPYFTWPMSVQNPGALFGELWSSATSAAAFLPLLGEAPGAASIPLQDFQPCFDPDLPAPGADPAALFAFNTHGATS
jgi:oligopeptidase A